jgi:SAM-dependent methyltransferase
VQVARAHEEHHARAFGYSKSNVTFTKGVIEDLEAAGIAAGSVDVIVSNCVINLSEDKAAVLSQAHRVLKHGGEMYFSDVYADRRIPGACAHCIGRINSACRSRLRRGRAHTRHRLRRVPRRCSVLERLQAVGSRRRCTTSHPLSPPLASVPHPRPAEMTSRA